MTDPAPAPRALAGPVLFLRDRTDRGAELTALLILPAQAEPPELHAPDGPVRGQPILSGPGATAVRYRFRLPPDRPVYEIAGAAYEVAADLSGDLRIAYASCNGQEDGDIERHPAERNVMWARLAALHAERPLNLLLQGGDQIYADEVTQAHPAMAGWPREVPDLSDATAEAADRALRAAFFARYLALLRQPEPAHLMARVPTLAMWDDHDICDGWGSLPAETLDSRAGRLLFRAARDHMRVFQQGEPPDAPEAPLHRDLRLPGLQIVAPDLRTERRRDRVLGPEGWRRLDASLTADTDDRLLLMSSVPALGPRLSWLEAVMRLTPRMEKYEDDLRDQWQSRGHRAEWRRLLRALLAAHSRRPVTVLSGEIHLATRAELATGAAPLHQLVASGVTHPPPPKVWAWTLDALARLGEAPLPGHPIRLRPLPGRRGIYCAQRNVLLLERAGAAWRAWWELEEDGPTPPLDL